MYAACLRATHGQAQATPPIDAEIAQKVNFRKKLFRGMSEAMQPKLPAIAGVITDPDNMDVLYNALDLGINVFEIRVDCIASADIKSLVSFMEYLRGSGGRTIVTIRSKKEGGGRFISDHERLEIFTNLVSLADYIDIELSSDAILPDVAALARGGGTRLIVSYHNFEYTPGADELLRLICECRTAGADMVKVAASVTDTESFRRLARITLDNRDMVTIAMGDMGVASRVFFLSLGSLLTYVPLTDTTAPGQLSLNLAIEEFDRYNLGLFCHN